MLQVVRATPVVVRSNGSLKLNSAHARRQRVHTTGKHSLQVEPSGGSNIARNPSPREKHHSSTPFSPQLAHSLQELCNSLESGHTAKQFEKVAKKANGMGMEESKLPHNMLKNRYRDVVPYDATRVMLKEASSGDYINASHIKVIASDVEDLISFMCRSDAYCVQRGR